MSKNYHELVQPDGYLRRVIRLDKFLASLLTRKIRKVLRQSMSKNYMDLYTQMAIYDS